MKFLYFHQHFSTPKGSAGIRSYQMARKLVARGHEVTIVCGRFRNGQTGLEGSFSRGMRRGKVDGIDVIEIDLIYSNLDGFLRRSVTFARFIMRTMSLVFSERYDVIFATTTPLTVGIPGILGRWLRGKPFVFEVRDLWPELPRAMGVIRNPFVLGCLSILEWASYRSAHRLVGLSPGIVEGIARRGVSKDRITLIPNGCDLGIFRAEGERWRPAGVHDGNLVAIFSGTHGLANGLEAVLDAASELRTRGRNDIKLILIGDGMMKPKLEERAMAENLTNVIFLDPVDKKKLATLLNSSDIGLQILANVPAFYYGTSPNKFFDYISAGIPVLNNYPGWLADMIKENECGFAIPADDPSKFADALERAAEHRQSLRAMGQRARKLAEREFDRDQLAERWADWVERAKS